VGDLSATGKKGCRGEIEWVAAMVADRGHDLGSVGCSEPAQERRRAIWLVVGCSSSPLVFFFLLPIIGFGVLEQRLTV
jgi:hypothetical protein